MAKKETYEDMMLKLQNVLLSLEENDLTLNESMKAYEEGTKLVNKLYKVLDTLEGKISVIKDEKEVEFKDKNENRWL